MLEPRTGLRLGPLAVLSGLLLCTAPSWAIEGGTDAAAETVEGTTDAAVAGDELPSEELDDDGLPVYRNPYAAPDDLEERWLPALSIGVEIYEERGAGTLQQTDLTESGIGASIPSLDSRNLMSLRMVAELAAPALDIGPFDLGLVTLQPHFRLFGYVGTHVYPSMIFASRTVGGLDGLGSLEDEVQSYLASRIRNPAREAQDPEDFSVQGSQLLAQSANESWILGFGSSYRHEYGAFDLRFRGSLEYFGERIETKAKIVTLLEPSPDVFEVINKNISKVQAYHSFGPNLELEAVVKRRGKVGISFYAQARYLWNVGDRNVAFSDDRGLVDITYRRPGARLRGGAGVRFSWQGL